MKPHEFVASVRARARARAAAPPAPQPPAAAPVIYADDEGAPLDPVWVEEQKASEAAAARLNTLAVDDDLFADAVWRVQVNDAHREPTGAGPSVRIARILDHGAASGLTGGQLAALKRLSGRIDAASRVLHAAERRRAVARPQEFVGSRRF